MEQSNQRDYSHSLLAPKFPQESKKTSRGRDLVERIVSEEPAHIGDVRLYNIAGYKNGSLIMRPKIQRIFSRLYTSLMEESHGLQPSKIDYQSKLLYAQLNQILANVLNAIIHDYEQGNVESAQFADKSLLLLGQQISLLTKDFGLMIPELRMRSRLTGALSQAYLTDVIEKKLSRSVLYLGPNQEAIELDLLGVDLIVVEKEKLVFLDVKTTNMYSAEIPFEVKPRDVSMNNRKAGMNFLAALKCLEKMINARNSALSDTPQDPVFMMDYDAFAKDGVHGPRVGNMPTIIDDYLELLNSLPLLRRAQKLTPVGFDEVLYTMTNTQKKMLEGFIAKNFGFCECFVPRVEMEQVRDYFRIASNAQRTEKIPEFPFALATAAEKRLKQGIENC